MRSAHLGYNSHMYTFIQKHEQPLLVALGVGLVLAALSVFLVAPTARSAGETLTGYAWSSNIGWICFSDEDGCATATVTLDASGNLTGYAWSSNIGWIKFGGLSGFPTGGGTTAGNARLVNDELTGWVQAISADGHGWDGWIYLGSTGHGDGIELQTDNSFEGYAWGGEVVGWVNFCTDRGCVRLTSEIAPCALTAGSVCSNSTTVKTTDPWCAETTTVCSGGQLCSNGACIAALPQGTLTIVPSRVRKNTSVQISWSVSNAKSCSVTGKYQGGTMGPYSGTPVTSAPVQVATIFTLNCVGLNDATYKVDEETVGIIPIFQEI